MAGFNYGLFVFFWAAAKFLDGLEFRKKSADATTKKLKACCGKFWIGLGLKLWNCRSKKDFGFGDSWLLHDVVHWILRLLAIIPAGWYIGEILYWVFDASPLKEGWFGKYDYVILCLELILGMTCGIILLCGCMKGKDCKGIWVMMYRIVFVIVTGKFLT